MPNFDDATLGTGVMGCILQSYNSIAAKEEEHPEGIATDTEFPRKGLNLYRPRDGKQGT